MSVAWGCGARMMAYVRGGSEALGLSGREARETAGRGGGGGANGGFGADFSQGLGVDDFPLLVGVGAGEAQSQYDALLSQVRALPQ